MTRIMGISEEVTTCECCGKSNLKRTVALSFDGAIRYYGCDCAAKSFKKSSIRGFNGADVRKLAGVAGYAQRHGVDAACNRFGYGHPEQFQLEAR